MTPILRLYEDVLSSEARDLRLPPLPRMIFVVHGTLTVAAHTFAADQAWQGDGAVALSAGPEGATCWRWELASDERVGQLALPGAVLREKLSARLDTLPEGDLLMRGDSVAFPPGGCAYLHTHQGPGIRCLLEGGIRIDTHGVSTSYGPGSPWFESGPDPVFAQAAMDRPSRFIRVMILPRGLIGKSSLQLVNEDDKTKPRAQQYKVFADAPIERPD
jgi:hypothetical protein